MQEGDFTETGQSNGETGRLCQGPVFLFCVRMSSLFLIGNSAAQMSYEGLRQAGKEGKRSGVTSLGMLSCHALEYQSQLKDDSESSPAMFNAASRGFVLNVQIALDGLIFEFSVLLW